MDLVYETPIDIDGMQGRIYARVGGGFNLTLFDTEAELTVPVITICPTLEQAIAKVGEIVKTFP